MIANSGSISGSFKFNADLFRKIVEGIAPDRWLVRPGNDSNHLLWVTGHTVWSRRLTLQALGSEWSRPWDKLFARGAKLAEQENYPKPEEVLSAWDDVSGKLAAVLDGVSPEDLSVPAPQAIPSFDGKLSGALTFFSIHESYHLGQMAYLRKWLGFGQSVG
jgi:hypothetical protein